MSFSAKCFTQMAQTEPMCVRVKQFFLLVGKLVNYFELLPYVVAINTNSGRSWGSVLCWPTDGGYSI